MGQEAKNGTDSRALLKRWLKKNKKSLYCSITDIQKSAKSTSIPCDDFLQSEYMCVISPHIKEQDVASPSEDLVTHPQSKCYPLTTDSVVRKPVQDVSKWTGVCFILCFCLLSVTLGEIEATFLIFKIFIHLLDDNTYSFGAEACSILYIQLNWGVFIVVGPVIVPDFR